MRGLILGLARPALRLLGRDERGAIGVMVAVMIGCGVLLGMGALVIDVGQLYQNRAELQNGADAGALAVAASCAHGTCSPGLAGQYATGNASKLTDYLAADLVCGSASLGLCAGPMAGCPAAPANGANYVDVLDSTLTGGNSSSPTLLPPVFGRMLLGNSSYNGTNVKACAQAEWGAAIQSHSLAFTLSLCAWNALTGVKYGTEIAVDIHGDAKQCTLPSGLNLPGGFGWLQTTSSSTCTASIDLSSPPLYFAGSDPGNNISAACQTALLSNLNSVIYLPVFDNYVSGNSGGNNGTYTLVGLAAFYLNGWINMHPLSDQIPTGMTPGQARQLCTAGAANGGGNGGNDSCLLGYFTQGLVPVTDAVGAPGTSYFGAGAVQLTG